ncbi:Por secretion system C-terminal sorting domain-containing protein [Zobellia uliginosa]|uniref:Por secretion system C-terminal sorting domain-containing protein n=1 Tax=Zobellia uliginosa TaxID=143224 RepID=A0ABY1KNX7_9FLAO|nr:T9SS type A sorting domain-containing protein [Zobellia uliginosa]SIS55002.1 Por secretion system C-terminal sorting domain-containing protein [Zobellia uliginosa]
MGKKNLFLIFLFIGLSLSAQEAIREVGEMPDGLSESSGLLFFNDRLITHNDSGNLPELYEIDTLSLTISRTVTVGNVSNHDWEDIAQDETYIYIGDFGNNNGTRKNLAIYRIAKSDYLTSNSLMAEKIEFSYEDQTAFENNGNSDWDAEALFVMEDQLVVLTKQWNTQGTLAYAVPTEPGSYKAKKLDGYAVDGLVTGADYDPVSGQLYLVGYSPSLSPFLYKIDGVSKTKIFEGAVERLEVDVNLAQIESIAQVDSETYFMSSERFERADLGFLLKSKLYALSTDPVDAEEEEQVEEEEETEEEEQAEQEEDQGPIDEGEDEGTVDPIIGGPDPETDVSSSDRLILKKQFGSPFLEYRLRHDDRVLGRALYDASGRRMAYTLGSRIDSNSIDISGLRTGLYFVTLVLENEVLSRAFIAP